MSGCNWALHEVSTVWSSIQGVIQWCHSKNHTWSLSYSTPGCLWSHESELDLSIQKLLLTCSDNFRMRQSATELRRIRRTWVRDTQLSWGGRRVTASTATVTSKSYWRFTWGHPTTRQASGHNRCWGSLWTARRYIVELALLRVLWRNSLSVNVSVTLLDCKGVRCNSIEV